MPTGSASGQERHVLPAPGDDAWNLPDSRSEQDEPRLLIDVAGFEGPLDLLLHLARHQKVDLTKISVLALAEQFLDFIETARNYRLELAADYLVMAAWMAYLKSRLLVPQDKDDEEPSGEDLALQLAFRLKRLEAMREAADRLMDGARLGEDVFARGDPEAVITETRSEFSASLYDLLTAYATQQQRKMADTVHVAPRMVLSLQDARSILIRLIGDCSEWTPLAGFLAEYLTEPGQRRTFVASSFAASLEMVRDGTIELRQERPFSDILIRHAAPSNREHLAHAG